MRCICGICVCIRGWVVEVPVGRRGAESCRAEAVSGVGHVVCVVDGGMWCCCSLYFPEKAEWISWWRSSR